MSLNVSAVLATIASLESQLTALKAQLGAEPAAAAKPSAAPRAKKESAPRPPTDWRLFADRVRELLRAVKKDDGSFAYTGTALGTGCVQFCATLKEENPDFASWSDADILARRVDWVAPTVSKQKAAGKSYRKGKLVSGAVSDASADGDGAAAAVAAAGGGPAASDGEAESTSSSKKRGPAKGTKWSEEKKAAAALKRAANKAAKSGVSNAAAVPLPASPPDSVAPSDEEPVLKRLLLNKKAYLVNLTNGHAYFRNADDTRGDWAGIFHRTGSPSGNGPYIESRPAPHTDLDELD